jgi:putative hemolysin
MPTLTYASPHDPPLRSAVIRVIERLCGRSVLEALYDAATSDSGTASDSQTVSPAAPTRFWSAALHRLGLRLKIQDASVSGPSPASLEHALPAAGPVVVVANHPYGIVDGLALCHVISRDRPDFRILINGVLCRDDRFDAHFLPVDFSESEGARRTNLRSVRDALRTLRRGGALAMFPAGGIATAKRPLGPAQDLPWKPLAAHLVQRSDADVVPIYFEGQNSRLFQWASQVSQTLRLSLIIREVLQMRGGTLRMHVGAPIANRTLASINDQEALTRHLRRHTLALRPGTARF